MEINELRIGSWVLIDNPHRPEYKNVAIQVVGLDVDSEEIKVKLKDKKRNVFSQFIKLIKPIPLTEDVLVKCGFEKKDIYLRTWNTVYYAREEYGLIVDDGDLYLGDYYEGYEGGYEHYFYDNKIKYVHQLQNLNYSLTGKELEIKLD